MVIKARGGITPLISVVIPVYNVAPYLREALDSVVNQTYKNLQVLIVDDGSTDGSGEICEEYKIDRRVTVIHQKNGGLSNARNIAMDRAHGQFIAFLDPDDAYHPSFIEELLSAIADADIAVCRFTIQKTDGRLITKKRGVPHPSAKAGTYGREESLRMVVSGAISCSGCDKLYRAELWKSIRFPDGQNFEDLDTTYRIVDICKTVTVIAPVLYFVRRRPDSITQTLNRKNLDDRKKATAHLEKFIRSHIPEIFSERDVLRIRGSMMNSMIVGYAQTLSAQKEDLRKEIIATGQEISVENCTFKCRAAFFIVKHCPWLLKGAYSVYYPLRLLVMKVVGK